MERGFPLPGRNGKPARIALKRRYRTQQTHTPRQGPLFTMHGAPMQFIAVTQTVRVTAHDDGEPEREDVLDDAWLALLEASGCVAMRVPNQPHLATDFLDSLPIDGLLLTCGNNLAAHGGDAPERDRTEFLLLTHAVHKKIPVLGVGRGMQVIQRLFSVPVDPIDGHETDALSIDVNGERVVVNSGHRYGATETAPGLHVWARADDGVVKAVRNNEHNITGIMWRPERMRPFRQSDIDLFRSVFGSDQCTVKARELALRDYMETL